ncbi:S9 family peptidase [Candidatus Synechococcus calcipolaris G9]|uniref:S9 family peptidase n=1 Tax=Candidatus Synechococcus calcipolaris G9 TaxID=1497997 RepID=A0ABT6EX66_9SYNE|nr:S9 family peptidase [Candidatus Synechococcus calcipolaris]MDG2990079.1 S9 family peptidase [Candidatus Synechococcus calcipolaris G9]
MVLTSPFGTWRSPLTPDLMTSQSIGLGEIRTHGQDIYWLETRPQEKGRSVLVRQEKGWQGNNDHPNPQPVTLLDPSYSVRSRVHEYGGGAYWLDGSQIFFVNEADQQIYGLDPQAGGVPYALTNHPNARFADGVVDRHHNRLICVQEQHSPGEREVINTLVAIPLQRDGERRAPQTLVSGSDFYSSPRLSPDGQFLVWLSWNHPQLPWDGTALWQAQIQGDGLLGEPIKIAGGLEEAVQQPRWLADGRLLYISDRSGWWNLYSYQDGIHQPLYPQDVDCGVPPWVFGQSTYAPLSPDTLVLTYSDRGIWHLGVLHLADQRFTPIDLPHTDIQGLQASSEHSVVFLASSPSHPLGILEWDIRTQALRVLKTSTTLDLDPGYISTPEPIAFPTGSHQTAYGFFYPPQNKDYQGPDSERPPLLVKSHGGPTAASGSGFDLRIQYWTSRGFAVLDVNYRGSTGYGRAYRQQLLGQWGIADVEDSVAGVNYLVAQGRVDGDRVAIRGSSAGGYTTLAALTFTNTFRAGASYYGIGDLEALAKDTHKFEARYLDRLIAPYPAGRDIYYQRSPIHFCEQLSCPVIFFQGLQDKVVPPNQAEQMVTALKAKGIPVTYLTFADERHGFRQGATIIKTLEAELEFYQTFLLKDARI